MEGNLLLSNVWFTKKKLSERKWEELEGKTL